MNVYMVFIKRFYTSNGKEYQMADALEPVRVYSSYAKANKAFEYYIDWYKQKFNYEGDEPKHRNLFPGKHICLTKTMGIETFKTIIYIIKSEVE